MTDANTILMGSGATAAKFEAGTTWAGRIVAISEPYQEREYDRDNPGGGALKTFPSGDPIMTFNLDIATGLIDPTVDGDDGTRRIYMDGARIKKAVREAVRAAGARGLTVGGHLQITCTHYDEPGDKRSGKNYAVQYTPGAAANNVLMQPEPTPAPQYAPAPAPTQPVAQPQYVAAPPQPAAPVAPVYTPAPVPQPAVATPAVPQPSPEQVAAVRAAGMDPATVWPGFVG